MHYMSNSVGTDGQFNSTQSRSAVELAGRYPHIRRWFLVERYTEQPKLEYSTSHLREHQTAQPGEPEVRAWSGIRQIGYPLIGDRPRPPWASSIDLLCYIYRLKRSWRGRVVHYTKIID